MPTPLPGFACTQSSTSLYMRDPPGGMTIRVSSSDGFSRAKAFLAALPSLTQQREVEAILEGMRAFSDDREVQYHGHVAMALLDQPLIEESLRSDCESELPVSCTVHAPLGVTPNRTRAVDDAR
jgi:hypothetical protein